jgi:hypothetical protein
VTSMPFVRLMLMHFASLRFVMLMHFVRLVLSFRAHPLRARQGCRPRFFGCCCWSGPSPVAPSEFAAPFKGGLGVTCSPAQAFEVSSSRMPAFVAPKDSWVWQAQGAIEAASLACPVESDFAHVDLGGQSLALESAPCKGSAAVPKAAAVPLTSAQPFVVLRVPRGLRPLCRWACHGALQFSGLHGLCRPLQRRSLLTEIARR